MVKPSDNEPDSNKTDNILILLCQNNNDKSPGSFRVYDKTLCTLLHEKVLAGNGMNSCVLASQL